MNEPHPRDNIRTERGELPPADGVELLPPEDLEGFRTRWERVQVAFVDQPREAVEQAHDLVDEVVDRLTQTFAEQRDWLEQTWTRGDQVSTEDLRVALQRYRSLFNRLLTR